MNRRRYTEQVAVIILYFISAQTANSQTENGRSTEVSTTASSPKYSTDASLLNRHNIKQDQLPPEGSLEDGALDSDEMDLHDVPNVKVLHKNERLISPESASKVILSVISNGTYNHFYSDGKNDTGTKVLIKHPVIPLEEDIAKRLKSELDQKPEIKVQYGEVTEELIPEEHPCQRECKEGEDPMICFYHFNLEWYQTMSKACYDCPYNETDCFRPDCIPADGVNRPLNVINRKMPGPAIEVCQHDRVIIDVENELMTESTTIHWHGHHQRGTPYMDGTPYVTQCPLLPEATFRYQFNASHAGTHFWHSHAGMQRADGAAGAFIVRAPKSQDPHARLYDYDRPDHIIFVTDWLHVTTVAVFTDHHHSKGDNKPPTYLVNGRGRFEHFNSTGKLIYMKVARFNVEQGYRYRFRLINAEFLNCPVEMSVDGHNITVIASDGYDLQPINATSLVSYAGERFDFIIEANNEIDNYWIKFRGLMDCDERFTKAKQVAVLHYEGAMESEPPGDPSWEELHTEGLQLNALNKGEEDNETISVAEMSSIKGHDDSLKEVADYQFYVAYDFYAKNNSHFHRSPYYGYHQVPNKKNRLYSPQLNHISMKMPTSPLLLSRPSPENFCNSSSVKRSCKTEYCECSHVLSVKLNSVVEVIIVDEGVVFDANHPFHLHGNYFRVVAMRRLGNQTTIEEVKEFDKAGLLKRNLKNAPLKDTVTVPDGGYTVIRFKADNPGYWLFHCHIEFHVEIGMALIFKVGEHEDMAPIPPNFPTCGNYMPDNMLEHATTEKVMTDGHHISFSHWWPVININSTSSASAPVISCFTILFSGMIFIVVS